ncbi:MAG: hypothetical protein A2042_00790 [Candidatus Schekmanbacteria bacterium GWA2_38_11]|uniref:Gingipain domain-containing protein n=1 Tax=Candidatus Schekmanbacteria bacterium GWA2_38_11 TaxID=1817876 RepID=A0A1F7RAC1_9BACT|nr:MAG: hypothetical protein A2042_00790 [Candidatus Schekmanbacteria bacterium GWA2_38_11]
MSNKFFPLKKGFIPFYIFILIISIPCTTAGSGKSNTSELAFKFNLDNFLFSEKNIEGGIYTAVSLKNGGLTDKPGYPQLPFKRKLVKIPDNADPEITFKAETGEVLNNIDIVPAPEIKLLLDSGKQEIQQKFFKSTEAYSQNKSFPTEQAELEGIATIRGNRVAVIRVYPLQYNPSLHKVTIFKKINVTVAFKPSGISGKKTLKANLFATGENNPAYPLLKIEVNEDGIYIFKGSNLAKAGFSLKGVNPQTFKLFFKGEEIPIIVKAKNQSKFGKTDYIEFFGKKNSSEYSDNSVYWLSAGGETGKRVEFKSNGTSGTGQVKSYFTYNLKGEENKEFIQTLPKEEGKDHWFWERIYPDKKSFSFNVKNLSTASDEVNVLINLQGLSDDTANPDHHTKVYINNNLIDDFDWDGDVEESRAITTTTEVMKEGANTLTIEPTGGTAPDYIILNNFTVSYPASFKAVGGELYFTEKENGLHSYNINGIKGNKGSVEVFDVTDSKNIKALKFKIKRYALKFDDSASAETEYLVTTAKKRNSPLKLEVKKESSGLLSASNGADYIIITHEDFYEQAKSLAQFHEAEGMRVKIAKINDIYDEFSYGFYDPQAIKDFLQYAYKNWEQPTPSYVLLLGDGNMDYKDYLKSGIKSFIPTKLVRTSLFGPTPSDTWYACVDGEDNIPDLYIGRIAASSANEADEIINKIINYNSFSSGEAWLKNILFVADNPDDAGDFEVSNDALEDELPDTYTAEKVYLKSFSSVLQAKNSLVSIINSGALITTYFGHGAVTNWAAEEIFTTKDSSLLSNKDKYTFLVTLNCLNGYFASAYDEKSLGEEFLKTKDSGAVAFWGPTGLGFNNEYEEVGKELFSTIFSGDTTILGKAVNESLINAYINKGVSEDYLKDMVFLGDPALKLKKPE